ncbi:MAG TPA: undecaprenyl-diphosphate phosphatase [Roseiflexaceae bacterium]
MQKTSSRAAALPATRARLTLTIFAAITIIGCVILSLAGYVRPVVMGVVQGLGEFLPISSSAHLILAPWFFGWQGDPVIDSLTFDVALHLGTLIALVVYFWHDWIDLLRAVPGLLTWVLQVVRSDWTHKRTMPEHILTSIVIATIPGAVIGVLMEKLAERSLRSPLLIAVTLAIMGVLLYLADKRRPEAKDLGHISWRDALLIGLAQACALIPGVSRSGATITMGRFLTFDRVAAARYSFLLSAPITAAAVLFKLKDIFSIPAGEIGVFLVGVLVSGAVGALAIGFLLNYIRRAGFSVFAIYRVMLAIVIVLVYFARS